MTQVSGSISLELGKVVRETTYAVVQEITRTVPTADEDEQGLPTPLAKLADAVTERVMVRLDRDLGGVLAEVRTGLLRLEELVQAEAQRRDRLVNGPATGEIPVLVEEYRPENDPTRPGMTPVGRMIPDPDQRLAEARRDGMDDSWYEEATP